MGMVADSVSDGLILTTNNIKPALEMGTTLDTSDLIGLVAPNERMLLLVNVDQLMSDLDIGLINTLAAKPSAQNHSH